MNLEIRNLKIKSKGFEPNTLFYKHGRHQRPIHSGLNDQTYIELFDDLKFKIYIPNHMAAASILCDMKHNVYDS